MTEIIFQSMMRVSGTGEVQHLLTCSYVPPIKTVFRHSNKQTKPVSYKHIDAQVHFVRWNMTGQNFFYNNSAARTKAETS